MIPYKVGLFTDEKQLKLANNYNNWKKNPITFLNMDLWYLLETIQTLAMDGLGFLRDITTQLQNRIRHQRLYKQRDREREREREREGERER